jgi:zinc transporter 1/2/3
MRDLVFVAARQLLQHAHGHGRGEDAHEDHAGHADHADEVYVNTLDLRIAAIFVIWFGAVVFGLPTLVFKAFRSQDAPIPRLFRAFAGGTIVALALVHIVPEAVHQLEGVADFHLAGCTILFGIVVLVLIDNSLAAYLTPEEHKQSIRDKLAKDVSVHKPQHAAAGDKQQHHQHVHSTDDSAGDLKQVDEALRQASSHAHQCMRGLSPNGWVSSAAAPVRNVRQYVTAYTMELGCIFHSVIIGVGVGVITNDRELVITLMVALAIHQGLEALALGSVLALTTFSYVKKVLMLFLYTITTPIGIAIGISIASTYDPTSITSMAVQGTINGVSSGMLIYIGMYQLIAEEFSREDLLVRPKLRYGMYAALLLGGACMCVLGVWA